MTKLFKNSKSVLSLVLAFAVLAVSLFTGVAIHSHAAAADEGTIDLLEFGDYLIEMGSSSKWYDTVLVDNGETGDSWANAIIIDSAEEFVYLCKAANNETIGKYYKVADGIAGFDLSKGDINLDGTLAENIDKIKAGGKNHSGGEPGFQGNFDGNGVTVYGAWSNHTEGNVATYAGLFSCTKGNVTIKNVNVKLASFTAKNAVGGIIGYHIGDGTNTLTVENCSVTDSHLEITTTGHGRGVGAIIGYTTNCANTGNGWINGPTIIKNCYVNLDEDYFISLNERGTQTDSSLEGIHGGLAAAVNTNALAVSDCVVIGIRPYASTTNTTNNLIQHSGPAGKYTNVYTDAPAGEQQIGGTGNVDNQNYAGKVFQLTADQMKGAAAQNMNLDWSVWMADADGYPELRNAHKNITTVDNEDGTHSETCACGFGGITVEHTFVDGVCDCGALLNCATRKTVYWDGTVAGGISTGTGAKDDPYIIKTAAEFAWLIQQKEGVSADKYFEIDESIGAIVLQPQAKAEAIMALADAAAVKAYFEAESGLVSWPNASWEGSCFAGIFDGNGATVYGLYQVSDNNAGLFSTVDAGAAIKNIALKNSYLTSKAPDYQVGAIAAVASGDSYGVKNKGVIWFDGCTVANNYMYNACTQNTRSGVIFGAASVDTACFDNCLVYGNDATYGNGVKMSIVASVNNGILSTTAKTPEGLEVKLSTESDGRTLVYKMVRNTVVLGSDLINVNDGVAWRRNDPGCYVNCYTDGASGEIAFTNGSFTYSEEQIKAITEADLATIDLGDAFLATAGMPELKSFHDTEFSATYDDETHSLTCSCGLAVSAEPHDWSNKDGVCAAGCGYECLHGDGETVVSTEKTPADCTNSAWYYDECTICGISTEEMEDGLYQDGEPLGHEMVLVEGTPAQCGVAGVKDYYDCVRCDYVSEDAAGDVAIDNLDEWKVIPALDHIPATDANGTVYAWDDTTPGMHYNVCDRCGENYNGTTCTGEYVFDDEGHEGECTVCGIATEGKEAHSNFDENHKCGTCDWVCTHAEYVDDGEPVELDFMDKTAEACKTQATKCAVCGTAGEDRIIGHVAGDWSVKMFGDEAYSPSCAGDGSHTEIQTCTECMFELDTRTVTDPKTGHAFSEFEASDPNCVWDGNIAYKYCPNCNYSFALDAADDEAYENALTDEERLIPADPEAHVWVEYAAGDADCENDGYSVDHKFCSACYLFVVDGETAEIGIDYEKFYEREYADENDWVGTPVGFGAIADELSNELYNECWLQYIADLGIELPEEPAEDASWEEWDAYYEAYYAALEGVDEEAFSEIWEPISTAIWNEAYHQYFLAEAADLIEVEEATGHTLVKVDEVAATYEKDGVKAHWACDGCDKLFADEDGTEEVTAEDLVIAKLVKEEKPADKPADTEDDKPAGDSGDKSPATGENVASVAAVAALMGAAFVLVRKSRKA